MKPLILIGMRGSGKSTLSQAVARLAGCCSVDLDTIIAQRAQCTIAELFHTQGEAAFRALESTVLGEVLAEPKSQVVATGGGVVLAEANCALMRASGVVVWLHAPVEVLWHRLQSDSSTDTTRPQLTTLTGEAELAHLLQQRESLYRSTAHHTVEAAESPEMLAETILSLWKLAAAPPAA